jgi:hypothetical protein
MINEKLIKKLLVTFYEGNTTWEEEIMLCEFFSAENLPEKWNTDKTLFFTLYKLPEINIPKDISKRLEDKVDKYITEDRNLKKRFKTKYLLTGAGSIAAAILLLVGIFFFRKQLSSENDIMTNTYTDPHEAAAVAEKVLTLVSTHLNKGLLPLEETNKLLNENAKSNH